MEPVRIRWQIRAQMDLAETDLVPDAAPVDAPPAGDGEVTAPAPPPAGGSSATCAGVILPYGVVGCPDGPWENVLFRAGFLDPVPEDPTRIKLFREHDISRPVAYATTLTDTAENLSGTFAVASSAEAQMALVEMRDKVLDGLSVTVDVLDIKENTPGLVEVTRGRLVEVSLVRIPAYDDARITSVSAHRGEHAMMTDSTREQLREDVRAVVREQLAAGPAPDQLPAAPADAAAAASSVRAARSIVVGPDGYGRDRRLAAHLPGGMDLSAGDYFSAYVRASKNMDADAETRFARVQAALAHEVTSLVPGLLPQVILDPIIGTATPVRRVWNSLAERVMPVTAGVFYRPRITQHTDVQKQAAEKTEVASRALKVELDDVLKETIAGALNLSVQAIDWTSPAVLDMVIADLARVYMVRADQIAADALVALATANVPAVTGEATPEGFNVALYTAAAQIYGSADDFLDTVADTLWLSPDKWAQLGGMVDGNGRPWLPFLGPANALGTSDPGNPDGGGMGSLDIVVSKRFPPNTIILGDSDQLEVYEDRRGFLRAEQPSILGVEIATYGYVGTYPVVPEAFVPITLTAPVVFTAPTTAPPARSGGRGNRE